MFEREALEEALRTLGEVLESRGVSFGVLVAGGSSLLLLGLVDRPTADLDIVALARGDRYVRAEPLPAALVEAIADVANALGLVPEWMNNGPASLLDFGLPTGFDDRVTVRRYGALDVHLPGRSDLVALKLYAAVDLGPRSKHFADLKELVPTDEELLAGARWARSHDPSPAFRDELVKALAALGLAVSDADV